MLAGGVAIGIIVVAAVHAVLYAVVIVVMGL